jgi:hypothetical protein
MRVTFLEATNGLRLSKHHSVKDGFKPYPHVKSVASHKYDIPVSEDGLEQFEQLLRKHAGMGHCLLKGNLKRDITDESRAGLSDRNALSNLLVIDVDGVRLSGGTDIVYLAKQVIDELPVELHNTSFIVQASSSIGFKGNRTSLHIFMFLTIAMPPKSIKLWLQDCNYESDLFSQQLELSVNGQSLKYPLDASVADNSKIIFIAPPTFDNPKSNPFADDDERIILVKRGQPSFDLAALMTNISPQKCHEKSLQHKDRLREEAGFKKRPAKTRLASIDNVTEEVLTNPDKMSISIVDTTSFPYIRCNINGGDSGAYYFNIEKPTYMYNFKDEPIFEIEKADKDFYTSIFETFAEELEKIGKAHFPIVMRDFDTDTFLAGLFDPNENQFSDDYPLTAIGKMNIEDFFMSHGKLPPDFIPDAKVRFLPTSTEPAINIAKTPFEVNTYRKTKYILDAKPPAKPLEFGTASTLARITPLIHTIMQHMLGDGKEEFERFINWLAYIYQTRRKTGVSWVLSGTQGTGKGIFYSRILRGLFGTHHAPMRYLQNMEEQFNLYMRDALFLVVDEFHMASSSTGATKMADKLKNQITEPTITIRGMRSNQVEMTNYTNFIFLTNRVDAVNIETGDRRYNIAPKQNQKLLDKYEDLPARLDTDELEQELWKFAGILATFKYDKRLVETAIDNTAKEQMRNVSMSVFDEFCQAVKVGNLTFFADILDINTAAVLHSNEIEVAQRLVKSWIIQSEDEYVVIPMEHLRTVYHIQTEQNPRFSQREFAKRMSRNGIETERKRPVGASRDTSPIRGVVTKWNLLATEKQNLIEQYLSDPRDQKLLQSA